MIEAAESAPENLHASAVVLGEVGVLVRGPSGAGKTRLALTLVETVRRDGRFARLVADDRTLVSAYGPKQDGVDSPAPSCSSRWEGEAEVHGTTHATLLRLVARPHPALAGRVERRGLGLLPIEHEPACLLGLIVDLSADPVPRLPEPGACEVRIAGASLPRLTLPADLPAADAVSLVLTRMAALAPSGQGLAPFSLPSPPRCTR